MTDGRLLLAVDKLNEDFIERIPNCVFNVHGHVGISLFPRHFHHV